MGPIRGQTRPVPVEAGVAPAAQHIDAKLNASIHNRFDVEVVDAATGKIKQRAQAENVICNQLWTRMLSPEAYFNYIHYGTGSGTPAANDTSLFTFSKANAVGNVETRAVDTKNHTYLSRKKISIIESESVGLTITEVGIGYADTPSSLCTHAMLKDMNGNQISIAKTNTDIVNIYATVFVHLNTQNFDGGHVHIVLDKIMETAVSYHALIRGLAGDYSGWLNYAVIQESYPAYSDGWINSNNGPLPRLDITPSYNATNKQITITVPRLAATKYNSNGLKRIVFYATNVFTVQGAEYGWYPELVVEYGGAGLPSTSITGETIGTGDGTTTDFATKFPFPTGATVFVDGTAASNVTVDQNSPVTNDVLPYLRPEYDDCTALFNNILPENFVSGAKTVLYNPLYEKGIASFKIYQGNSTNISCSDDKVTWSNVATAVGDVVTVPQEFVHAKYWKVENHGTTQYTPYFDTLTPPVDCSKSIHFATAPTAGAVITADYTTPVVAKDANHVFDLTVTIQLGEHTS